MPVAFLAKSEEDIQFYNSFPALKDRAMDSFSIKPILSN